MYIQLSELKTNPVKYFDLAKTTEVIVTRHGQRIGRIISEEEAVKADRKRAVDALIGSVELPPAYDDPSYDPHYEQLREAAYRERGLLE